jgi:5-formyltetrahydrofolate cyclo-ligase
VTGRIALAPHDIPVDFIVTPEESISTKTRLSRPEGIYWDCLDDEKIAAIPLLKRLRAGRRPTRPL